MEERTPAVVFHDLRTRNTKIFFHLLLGDVVFRQEQMNALVHDPAGLDLTITDEDKMSVVHHMAATGAVAWLKHLSRQEDAQKAFCAVDHAGWTPLHFAVKNSHVEVVEFLIQNAPEILNEQTFNGFSPLFIAMTACHSSGVTHEKGWQVLEVLLRAEAEGDAMSMMKRAHPHETTLHERLETLLSSVQSELRGPPK